MVGKSPFSEVVVVLGVNFRPKVKVIQRQDQDLISRPKDLKSLRSNLQPVTPGLQGE